MRRHVIPVKSSRGETLGGLACTARTGPDLRRGSTRYRCRVQGLRPTPCRNHRGRWSTVGPARGDPRCRPVYSVSRSRSPPTRTTPRRAGSHADLLHAMSGSHGVRGRVPARDVRGAVPGVGLRGAQPERARSGQQGRALHPRGRSLLSRGRRGSSGVGARERGRLGRARHHVHGRAARRLRPCRRLGRERRRPRGPATRTAGVAAAGVQFLEVRGAEGTALRPRRAWIAR